MNPIRAVVLTTVVLANCSPNPEAQAPCAPEPNETGTAEPPAVSSQLAVSSAGADSVSPEVCNTHPPTPRQTPPLAPGASGTSSPPSAFSPSSPEAVSDSSSQSPAPTGPASGGPRGTRPCAFHESVDTYERTCVVHKNPDGSLRIKADGTRLNPDNGFEFTMHGGPYNFVADGTLDAFGICAGHFRAQGSVVVDKGVTTYELRFKDHCKIVIR